MSPLLLLPRHFGGQFTPGSTHSEDISSTPGLSFPGPMKPSSTILADSGRIPFEHPLLTYSDTLKHVIHMCSFTMQMYFSGGLQHRLHAISFILHWKKPTNLTCTQGPKSCQGAYQQLRSMGGQRGIASTLSWTSFFSSIDIPKRMSCPNGLQATPLIFFLVLPFELNKPQITVS